MTIFYRRIAAYFSGLRLKLQQAGMYDEPEDFIKKTIATSFYLTTALAVVAVAAFSKEQQVLLVILGAVPFLFLLLFLYFVQLPDVILIRIEKEIDREIVFAGRFLVIELQSGVPLYDAFINIAANYPSIGKYFAEIAHQIDLGTPIEEALNTAVELTPSANFRKLLWQIVNSLKTGSDVTSSLTTVIDQIQKEQVIAVKQYGRKLTPLAMFYMIIAIIAPTLGITMLVVLSSFIAIELDLAILLTIAGVLGFIQFLFLALLRSARPSIDL